MYEPLSDRAKRWVKWSTIVNTIVLVIVTTLTIGFIGKNITYTVRLTPPSQQQQLDEAYIYYFSQVSIVALGLMLNIAVLGNSYAAFNIRKKRFRVVLSTHKLTQSFSECSGWAPWWSP